MNATQCNHFGMIEVKGSIVVLCAVLGASGPLVTAAEVTQKEAVVEATDTLGQLVVNAHGGQLTPEQLRDRRIRVERHLDQTLSDAPAATHPKELAEVDKCRTDFNQQIIRSQEYEFFGPNDNPQWGWYPSRQIKSAGTAVKVDNAGRAAVVDASPQG